MKRSTSIALIATAALLAGPGTIYAQEADIKAAIGAYHAALESLDMNKMAPLWAHDAGVTLINPAGKIAVGWDAVKTGWDGVPLQWSQLKITPMDGPYIQVKGDVAWTLGMVTAAGKSKAGDTVSRPTVEADVFEKRGGTWLLVSHAASGRPAQQ